MEDEPEIITLPDSDEQTVSQKFLRFPIFANKDWEDAHICSLIPDKAGNYDFEEVPDKVLNFLLGLEKMLFLEGLILDEEGKNKRSKWKCQFLLSVFHPYSADCIPLELLQPSEMKAQ